MADIDWPATLPQYLMINGFSQKFADNMLASSVDVGISKRRKRYTVAKKPVTGSIYITSEQKTILEDFYDVSLGGGVLRFNWVDPITQDEVEMRFADNKPPEITPNGPINFFAKLELEIIA